MTGHRRDLRPELGTGPVPGTPRWAAVVAWLPLASVLPASIWRTAVGLGIPLGWSPAHLNMERIPGYGTIYVIFLSVLSIGAAALTVGLVRPWGERVPAWVPWLRGRLVPVWLVASLALGGAVVVAAFCWLSIVHWSSVSGFADRPTSFPALVMVACYLPMLVWAPALVAVTIAYVRRRRRPRAPSSWKPSPKVRA